VLVESRRVEIQARHRVAHIHVRCSVAA
jgi:hypothetical protein